MEDQNIRNDNFQNCEKCKEHHIVEDIQNIVEKYSKSFYVRTHNYTEEELYMMLNNHMNEYFIPSLKGHSNTCLEQNLNIFVDGISMIDVIFSYGLIETSISLIKHGANAFLTFDYANNRMKPSTDSNRTSAGNFMGTYALVCEDFSNIPKEFMIYLINGMTERDLADLFEFTHWRPRRAKNMQYICENLICSERPLDYVNIGNTNGSRRIPLLILLAGKYHGLHFGKHSDDLHILRHTIKYLMDNYRFDLTLEYRESYFSETLNIPSTILSMIKNSIFDEYFYTRIRKIKEIISVIVPQPITEEILPELTPLIHIITEPYDCSSPIEGDIGTYNDMN